MDAVVDERVRDTNVECWRRQTVVPVPNATTGLLDFRSVVKDWSSPKIAVGCQQNSSDSSYFPSVFKRAPCSCE